MRSPDPIALALSRRRAFLGLSQREVALRMGYAAGHSLLGQWERGEVAPTLKALRRWSRALGVDLALTPAKPAARFVHSDHVVDWGRPVVDVHLPEERQR